MGDAVAGFQLRWASLAEGRYLDVRWVCDRDVLYQTRFSEAMAVSISEHCLVVFGRSAESMTNFSSNKIYLFDNSSVRAMGFGPPALDREVVDDFSVSIGPTFAVLNLSSAYRSTMTDLVGRIERDVSISLGDLAIYRFAQGVAEKNQAGESLTFPLLFD